MNEFKTEQESQRPSQDYQEINTKTLGNNSVSLSGEVSINKPQIPFVDVNFFTKVAPKLLFSIKPDLKLGQKDFVVGMDWFDTKLKLILNAIRSDDPFAEQVLYDIEKEIYSIGVEYKNYTKELESKLNDQLSSFDARLHLNENMHIYNFKLTFQNRLTYDMLWALKELDKSLYYLYLCDKYAVISGQEAKEKRYDLLKRYRQMLYSITRWKNTAITRDDVAHNTSRLIKTFEVNKEIQLTKEVLLLDVRAESAPDIPTRKGNRLDSATYNKISEMFR